MTAIDQLNLTRLWNDALNRPMHNSSCGCAVPSAIRIDASTLELDVIDYVEEKYALRAIPEWAEAVKARTDNHTSNFPAWLMAQAGRSLKIALHTAVMADVFKTLNSMVEHSLGRLAPVNSLNQGWLVKEKNFQL